MAKKIVCLKCGQEHGPGKCGGHSKSRRKDSLGKPVPCRNNALPNQAVCGNHGGRSPQALTAAERRGQEQLAEQAVTTYGLARDIEPTEALIEVIHLTAGAVEFCRSMVSRIKTEDLVSGVRQVSELTGSNSFGPIATREVVTGPILNMWVQQYEKEREKLARFSAIAIKAGLEERRIEIEKEYGNQMAGVVNHILSRLNLSAEQQGLVSEIVPEAFRMAIGQ